MKLYLQQVYIGKIEEDSRIILLSLMDCTQGVFSLNMDKRVNKKNNRIINEISEIR